MFKLFFFFLTFLTVKIIYYNVAIIYMAWLEIENENEVSFVNIKNVSEIAIYKRKDKGCDINIYDMSENPLRYSVNEEYEKVVEKIKEVIRNNDKENYIATIH